MSALRFVVIACAAASSLAFAQGYPQRPITLVNPTAAGGANESIKAIVLDRVGAALGTRFVMESKGGAGGSIGAAYTAKAAPDGYTLLLAGASIMATNPITQKDLPYDAVRDFTPIAMVIEAPLLLVVHKTVPASNAQELVELLRRSPGKLNYGSYGLGTTNFLAMELFKSVTGTDVVHIPYKGSAPLQTALMTAEVQAAFEFHATIKAHVEAGTLKILGVASPTRFAPLPNVPTLREQGIAVEASGFTMLVGPAGIPAPITDRLNAEVNAVLAEPDVRKRLAEIGYEPGSGSREATAQRVVADTEKWRKLVKEIGFKPE